VRLSMKQKDVLTILLTGRAEKNFSDIITRIVKSKKLDFNMICLRKLVGPNGQRFTSTMRFKQGLLEDLMYTYKQAEEMCIYEDRPKQYVNPLFVCLDFAASSSVIVSKVSGNTSKK
jgi:hypothetical protein